MKRSRSVNLIFILVLLVATLACIRLGFWQLTRLEQRMARNQSIHDQLGSPLKTVSGKELDFQRVIVEGNFLPEHQFVLKKRTLNEFAGFHLVTPLQTEAGRVILVDRGWIPYNQGSELTLEMYRHPGAVEVLGVLQPSQAQPRWDFLADPVPTPGDPPLRSWRLIDIDAIQDQVPFPLHNQDLSLTQIKPKVESMPTPNFQVDLSDNPYLSYAIQWFSFAAIALTGGGVFLLCARDRSASEV
jgi:cytochrome oxidase assembly protein ShyY1